MNFNSVILVGTVALSAFWWMLHATRHYPGPKVMELYIHDDSAPLDSTGIIEKTDAPEKHLSPGE